MRGTNPSARWRRKAAVIVWQHRRTMNNRGQPERLLRIVMRRSNHAADLGEVIHRTACLFEVAVEPIDRYG